MREATKVLATAAGTAAALEAARRIMRTPVLTWGATDEEVARKLPGDDLLADAAVVSTRAITVDAPPAAVWPWSSRWAQAAVAPSHDWIENLFGLEIHSADTIHLEVQDLAVGGAIPGRASLDLRVEVLSRIARWCSGRPTECGSGLSCSRPDGSDQAVEPEPDRDGRPIGRRPDRWP